MVSFFIAPYRLEVRDAMAVRDVKTPSDLRIDPVEYKALLMKSWPGIRFLPAEHILLGWVFPATNAGAGPIGGLEDHQTVIVDTPFEEYFLWHRSVIPARYPLYLFHEGSWETMELKPDTTLAEIRIFVGGPS